MHNCLCALGQHDGEEARHCKLVGGRPPHLGQRERGKSKMSSIEEAWRRDVVDSSAGCGPNVGPDGGLRRLLWPHIDMTNWRVARHDSQKMCRQEQLTKRRQCGVLPGMKEKIQIRETDQAAHLLVYIHLRAAEWSARSEAGNAEQKDAEKKEEEGTNLRSVMIAATLAALVCLGRGPLDPPWPSICLPPCFL